MALCNCSGHTKYIHLGCLVEWVRKRSGISEDYSKDGVYCVQARAFTCEVCKSLYRVDRLLRQVFKVDKSQLE
jgi:E3 ubiquitin-protein ligase DOA10